MISFTVLGIPVPQGSKRVVPTHAGPRAIETNEKRLRPWRSAISYEAQQAMQGREVLAGPVLLVVQFVFPRPKAHFGSGSRASALKASAPRYVESRPDVDKLVRSIGDALTGICVRDDSQFARVEVEKVYGPTPCAIVELWPLVQSATARAA